MKILTTIGASKTALPQSITRLHYQERAVHVKTLLIVPKRFGKDLQMIMSTQKLFLT